MKKLLLLISLITCYAAHAQQGGSVVSILPGSGKHYGLYGIGNLNTESFNNVNGSGKLAGYVVFGQNKFYSTSAYIAVNRNATNNDSTLASTLLFPDVGKSSFIGTFNYIRKINHTNHFLGGFCEGAFKFIKGERTIKTTGRDTSLLFSILDWRFGVRYIKHLTPPAAGAVPATFGASIFLNYYNIPDEDNGDYRFIFDNNAMPSDFWGFGAKITMEVNKVALFADFRHVFGSEIKMPNRDLRGFNLNVGVVFNGDLFEQ